MASSGYNPTFPGKWIGLHFMFGFVNITLSIGKAVLKLFGKSFPLKVRAQLR